ncbi:maternal effect embryo arrest 22 [Euphorbia peplus]|nr:maternal effect embryo arrest 22 [Euphorbia peplus]
MASEDPPLNPCCSEWKDKCSKIDTGRKYARRTANLLYEQVQKMEADKLALNKAYAEELARAATEKAGKDKELALRISLQNEIAALRSEISSLKQNGSTDTGDGKGEVKLLQDSLSRAEREITQLKALLEEEKIKADCEKKNVEKQKISASEAWKQVKSEKGKANDEKKLANIERKKAEEYRIQLEALRKEAEEAKSELVLKVSNTEEVSKKLEAEKLNVMKERKRADQEMVKAEKQRKLAEAFEKNIIEEKSLAENLSRQLEDARRKIEELKEKNSFISSRNCSELPVNQHDQGGITALKSEITSLQQTTSTNAKDKMREKEINVLKELLDKEKKRADSAKKSASEAGKHLKAEKTKVDKEKKNADTERKKAEGYQTKFEALRKEANETKTKLLAKILEFEEDNQKLKMEKSQLSCQLEESRHKTEELQKQVLGLLSSRSVTEAPTVLPVKDNSQTRKLKLVQEKLKLEKMRLKYAKQMAKLEENRNSTLQQELGCIKLDSVKISQRLDALDKWFLSGTQYREDFEKAGLSANMQKSTLKRKLCDLDPFPLYAQSESELLKCSCRAMTSCGPLRQTLQCTDEILPTCEGNRTEAFSGIHSKLKPLQGGSYQKLIKSSAINSSSTSCSDSQLVGSQVKGAFVSASDKCVEENCDAQTCSGISSEVTKIQCNENLAMVAENSVRSPHCVDAFVRVNGHGRKFMGMCDAIESVKHMYSEGKKLHMQMEEKLSILHGVLHKEMDKPPEASKYVEVGVQCGPFAKHDGGHKKRKVSHDDRTIMKDLSSKEEQEKIIQIGNVISEEATADRLVSSSDIELLGAPQESVKGLIDCFGSDLEPLFMVGDVNDGDYMKLLDLDNSADEECFREAMEMPLSPTLPEIEISAEIFDVDTSHVGDSLDKGVRNDMEIIVPSHSFDMIKVDASSNNCRYEASGLENERDSNRRSKDTEVVQLSSIPRSGDGGLVSSNISSISKLESKHDSILAYCVVFSDIKNSGSISRIYTVTRICWLSCSVDTERDCILQKILHFLKMEDKLSPKEKACVLFTLLLLNFSACLAGDFGSYSDKDFIFCSDSFSAQINAVMSDVEARSLFMDFCFTDGLLGLFEDFLLNGQLVLHTGVSSEASSECDARMSAFLDGVNISLSYEPASSDQVLAGSCILALICTAVDRIELIWEASYNLLRSHKYDNNVLLTILHIFANFSGKKFFSSKEYSLTMTVVKSIVTNLEREIPSVTSTCHSSLPEPKVWFHPCVECPFDAVSKDTALLVLSEKLHSYAHITLHQMDVGSLSNSQDVYCNYNTKYNTSETEVSCGIDVNCDASCVLSASVMPTAHFNSVGSGTLCELSDVLSLVELLACYMSWEWTSGKIIPVLLESLEKPIQDHFAVAIFILLGQLGRLGVAAHNYEDKEVENLRCRLRNFLCLDNTNSPPMSLSVQIATTVSLLQLLSLNVEGVFKSDLKVQEVTTQSFVDHIRKWFSLLSQEQQNLALGVLKSTEEGR